MQPIRDLKLDDKKLAELDRSQLRPVLFEDFLTAFREVTATVGPDDIDRYLLWNKQFGTSSTK